MSRPAFSGAPVSVRLPPRFFQLDASTLQAGLEARLRDALHDSVAPLVAPPYIEAFRALVELGVAAACLVAALQLPRGRGASAGCTSYGDHVYNLRYVVAGSPTAAGGAAPSLLLLRLLIRFVLVSVLPLVGRMLVRAQQQLEEREQAEGDARPPALRNPVAAAAAAVRVAGRIARAADLANHVDFLVTGAHRSVVDRALGLRLASGERDLQLSSHTYLIDRQHFWATVLSAASLFVPLLNVGGWARYLAAGAARGGRWIASAMTGAPRGDGGAGDHDSAAGAGHGAAAAAAGAARFECLVCRTDPMAMPRRVRDCGHVCVCYYCASTARLDECPLCHGRCSGFTA
jgi:hypothetical protein